MDWTESTFLLVQTMQNHQRFEMHDPTWQLLQQFQHPGEELFQNSWNHYQHLKSIFNLNSQHKRYNQQKYHCLFICTLPKLSLIQCSKDMVLSSLSDPTNRILINWLFMHHSTRVLKSLNWIPTKSWEPPLQFVWPPIFQELMQLLYLITVWPTCEVIEFLWHLNLFDPSIFKLLSHSWSIDYYNQQKQELHKALNHWSIILLIL